MSTADNHFQCLLIVRPIKVSLGITHGINLRYRIFCSDVQAYVKSLPFNVRGEVLGNEEMRLVFSPVRNP